eukprot:scaffold269957_cov18-Tisochrysis_lutea.AAC.1
MEDTKQSSEHPKGAPPTRGNPMVDTTASTRTASRLRVGLMEPICAKVDRETTFVHATSCIRVALK